MFGASLRWSAALTAALLVHIGIAVVILWQPAEPGATNVGVGGIEISLGPAGSAPGGAQAVEAAADAETLAPDGAGDAETTPPKTTELVAAETAPQPSTVEEVPLTAVTETAVVEIPVENAIQPPDTAEVRPPELATLATRQPVEIDPVAVEQAVAAVDPPVTIATEAVTLAPAQIAVAHDTDAILPETEPIELTDPVDIQPVTPIDTPVLDEPVVDTATIEPTIVERTIDVAEQSPVEPPDVLESVDVPPVELAVAPTTTPPPVPTQRPRSVQPEETAAEPVPEIARPTVSEERVLADLQETPETVIAETPATPRGAELPTADELAAIAPSAPGDGGQSGTTTNAERGAGDATIGGGKPGATVDYIATLQAWLEKHKEYPRRAQRRRQEGTALLYFVMDNEGRVIEFRLEESSGHKLLDEEVAAMLERAQPLPKMPEDMQRARLELVVPISFLLR